MCEGFTAKGIKKTITKLKNKNCEPEIVFGDREQSERHINVLEILSQRDINNHFFHTS